MRNTSYNRGGRWSSPNREYPVKVTLECGCTTKKRDRPMPNERLICHGTGHGYRLRWTSYVEGDVSHENPNIP